MGKIQEFIVANQKGSIDRCTISINEKIKNYIRLLREQAKA